MNINKLVSAALFIMLLTCFQAWAAKDFSDNGNGTVTDNSVSLVWQQGEGGTMTWEAALTYCENLGLAGLTDWRLPNTNELLSLVDDSRTRPSLETAYFPGAVSGVYWSSTTYVFNSTDVWGIYYKLGNTNKVTKSNSYYVRCVRGGQ